MPFQNDWLVPDAVILVRFAGETTEEDMIASTHQVNAMIDTCEAPIVHVIVDSTAVTASPPLPATIKAAKAAPTHERAGWLVTVGGQNAIVKFLMNVARQLLKTRTQNIDTLEEAIAFLKDMDDTVDWSQMRAEVLTTR